MDEVEAKWKMRGISRKSDWALISFAFVLFILASCATEPYYEAAPVTPTNVSPDEDVNISANASTTFTWLSTENTQYYEFHIYNQNTKDTTQYLHDQLQEASICQDGRCSLTLNVDLPTSKGHAWRVRAGNNAGLSEWNRTRFSMIKASTSTESIADESTESSTETSAESGEVVDLSTATQASENEEVNQSASQVTEAEVMPGAEVEFVTNFEESAEKIDEGAENTEEVAELDTAVSESSDAEKELLKTNSQSESNGPDLIQPDEDVSVATGSLVDFKWRTLPEAVSYDFFIYDSVSKEMVESLTDIAAELLCTSENVCGLTREIALPEAHHSWRVRANFEDSKSPYSSHRFVITP